MRFSLSLLISSRFMVWFTLVTIGLVVVFQYSGADEFIGRIFFDASLQAFPLKNDFWARDVLHHWGRKLMLTVWGGLFVAWIICWLLAFRWPGLRHYRRALAYLVLVMTLSIVVVNVGKRVTNTDCPWDLVEFGGERQHYRIFEDKPESLPAGRCFPAGHASGGYSLLGLFFVAVSWGWRRPWLGLLPSLGIGSVFSVAQWSRGAHFPSHDMVTLWLCWLIAWLFYAKVFRGDLGQSKK